MSNIYDFEVAALGGKPQTLAPYQGQVMLIVNVASKCGLTPQYTGLESLYRKYKDRGLVVLGFPCNQFANQEPGGDDEIRSFCSTSYDVSFPLFRKLEVNGPGAHPLYQYLKSKARGIFGTGSVKWNFTKFLVGRNGEVLKRYSPAAKPETLEKDIEAALAKA